MECLLRAGAPVNAADASGNTPLHAVLSKPPEEASPSPAVWLKVIDLLLEYGAHVDIANAKREIAADKMPPSVDVFNHVSLQCVGARNPQTPTPAGLPSRSAYHARRLR